MTESEMLEQLRLEFFRKLDNPNFIAKIIAAYVRNNLEDFHDKYLTDKQMGELNPLIRNAIYTAILDIANQSSKVAMYAGAYVEKYWEDCEYMDRL